MCIRDSDGDVEAAVFFNGGADAILHGGAIAGIEQRALDRAAGLAQPLGRGFKAGRIDIGEHDMSAVLGLSLIHIYPLRRTAYRHHGARYGHQ